MRADEQYPKYPEYRADLPHHYPPPPSFDQRYAPILSTEARISNRLTGLMQTFTFLTSQDSWPGQSRAVGLGPKSGPPLLSDPQSHNQVGHNCYFKHLNSFVAVVTITISTRASALLHKTLSGKRGNELRCSQLLPDIVHRKQESILKEYL